MLAYFAFTCFMVTQPQEKYDSEILFSGQNSHKIIIILGVFELSV